MSTQRTRNTGSNRTPKLDKSAKKAQGRRSTGTNSLSASKKKSGHYTQTETLASVKKVESIHNGLHSGARKNQQNVGERDKKQGRTKSGVARIKSATQKEKRVPKSIKIGQELCKLWDVPTRTRNDDFIIDSISGVRNNDISLWPSLRIQRYRTTTCIDTKIKSQAPLQSDTVTISKFIETQVVPVLGDRYSVLLSAKIDEVFDNFPYQAVLDDLNDQERRPIITNGSAYPPILAPVITGIHGNAELIAGMTVGRGIYKSDFHMSNILVGAASGKVTTVPKNYKASRVITITNREIIDKQYVVSTYLRDWITKWSRTSNHITQFDDQTIQHSMLKVGNATIDLSSASDRVYRSLLEKVWPKFTEHFGHLLPTDVITDTGRIVNLTCVGTQGYPLTFTLMAIVIGLIVQSAKVTAEPSTNYGDDITLSEKDFNEVYTALQALGLVINKSKTFKSSDGFLESCGQDVMFTRNGPRNITPIYLRGESDVEIIQFFFQLCKGGLIDAIDATSIMDRLGVEYYAFDYDHQLTEFHFPYGDIKNVPKPIWSQARSHYVCTVPAIKQEVVSIKGLSQKESDTVLELLHIEAGLKNPNNSRIYVRGLDSVARPYAILDLQDSKLYQLYRALDTTEDHVPVIFYEELEEKYKTTFKALMYYKFITSELYRYRFSTATVDFSDLSTQVYSLQEFIDSEFGVNSETRYPIYRYKMSKGTKTVFHPKTINWLGLQQDVVIQN